MKLTASHICFRCFICWFEFFVGILFGWTYRGFVTSSLFCCFALPDLVGNLDSFLVFGKHGYCTEGM